MNRYFISRNRDGRPTLLHHSGSSYRYGSCGVDARYWSVVHVDDATARMMSALYCKKCKKIQGGVQ